jgi:hypothetical protein
MDKFIVYIQRVLYISSFLPYNRFKILYRTIPDLLQRLETMIYTRSYTREEVDSIRYDFEQHIASIFGYEMDTRIQIRIDV